MTANKGALEKPTKLFAGLGNSCTGRRKLIRSEA
nr:MAG TPA: hypothetical protein [Caudoviricetes sp.]DAH59251.1 MAG TPA: hypothetical protein [Caudoviricetes sp.]DAI25493.1 MAG TPA: hypothetical protein [Caudoviricetes sp.]